MSRKYKELAEANKTYIENLRKEISSYRKKASRYDALRNEMNCEENNEFIELFETLPEIENELRQRIFEIEDAVVRAYEDVPFKKSRNAGIAAFWKEVGGVLSL